VVESCGRGEAAEVAGLRPGDVVVEWRQGRANGAAESPFHLAIAEQELSPHGPVELVIRRASKRQRVVIPTGRWRALFQPVLGAPARAAARAAEEAEENGAFDTAAELWRSLAEDSIDTGRALDAAFFHTRCGVALAQAGRGDEASAALSAGTDHLSDRRLLAAYWERAGALFLKAGRAREAAQAFRAAIELLEIHAPDSPGMAHAQVQLCRTNYRACATEISRALEIYRGLEDESLELAGALTVEGTVWYFQGDLDAAEYSYRRALEIVGATAGGSPFEGELLGNLGLVAMKRGDFATARGLFERDMVIAEGIGPGTAQYSHSANYLGLLAKKTGRYELARLHYEKALRSSRIMNPDGPEVAGVLTNLGNVALREMDYLAARRYHEEALALRRHLDPMSADVAASLQNLGRAVRRMADFESAQRNFEQALELKLEIGPGTGWLANTLFELGEVAREEGRLDEATAHHLEALEIRRRVSPQDPPVAESLFALGDIQRVRGHPAEAERLWRESITMIEDRRRRIRLSNRAQNHFGAIHDTMYGNLARLLVEADRVGEAWDTLEMARAAELRSVVAHREAAPSAIPPGLWFAKTRAEGRMARLESRLARIDPAEEEEALHRYREQLASVETELEAIGGQILEVAPRYAELGSPPALTLARLRRLLEPGTMVLAYTIGHSRSMVMATGSEKDGGAEARAFIIPVGREELRGRVGRFNSLISRGRTIGTIEPAVLIQGRRLFDLLVGPAAEAIAQARRILIIPDGPLHELPFAALSLPGGGDRFLGQVAPLFFNPSASLAVELGSGSSRGSTGVAKIVAFGDPEYPHASPVVDEHQLGPLPGSRAEVEAIQRLFNDRATVFLGSAATKANFKAHAGSSSVLHCAVHARIDPSVSMESALFFSQSADPARSPEDGVLTAWDIVDTLDLNAELVVLSACSTARGRIVPGEGIIGLARAFQVAGTRSVLVSQWAVDDHSTSELMTAFYEQLADGRSTVEALQRAQQIVGSDPELAHPYHWASFQLRGDWR